MRLIDADALSKKWQEVLDEKADEKGTLAYITFELFIDRLKEEPTIEAEPVKRGRWETNSDRPDSLICSICKCGFDMWKHDPHNYCPNCGAKMYGGDNDAAD